MFEKHPRVDGQISPREEVPQRSIRSQRREEERSQDPGNMAVYVDLNPVEKEGEILAPKILTSQSPTNQRVINLCCVLDPLGKSLVTWVDPKG